MTMNNYENCQRGPWQKGNWYNLWLLKSEEAAEKIIDELVIAKGGDCQGQEKSGSLPKLP